MGDRLADAHAAAPTSLCNVVIGATRNRKLVAGRAAAANTVSLYRLSMSDARALRLSANGVSVLSRLATC
jgi:hypothetical protein